MINGGNPGAAGGMPSAQRQSGSLDDIVEDMLPEDPVFRRVAEEVVYTRIKTVGQVVLQAIDERDALQVINRGLAVGLDIAGRLYAAGRLSVPEVMMAARTMEVGRSLAEERLEPGSRVVPGDGDPVQRAIDRDAPISVDAVARYIQVRPPSIPGTPMMTSPMVPFGSDDGH